MTETLRLPDEPEIGLVVEILNGINRGSRYLRGDDGMWRQIAPYPRDDAWPWSAVWWAVTEDGGGGDEVRVMSPIEAENDPLFSMRCYKDDDVAHGYLWIKMAMSRTKNWRNWHGLERSDAEMDGSKRVPLREVARKLGHGDAS